MSIRIQHTNGLDCPKVFCDHCGKPIDQAADGNAQWRYDDGVPSDGRSYGIFFTHKACCRAFEFQRGGMWLANDLTLFVGLLLRNTHIGTTSLATRLMLLDETGV